MREIGNILHTDFILLMHENYIRTSRERSGFIKEAIMKYGRKFLTLFFAMFMIAGGLVVTAAAQRRGATVTRTVQRPIVVRRYYRTYDPFWRTRYWGSPYYGGYGFYDPYYYSPYLRYKDQQVRLAQELAGNRRELQEHLRKYRADGVITAKEQRELDDDYKDVRNAEIRLRQFNRNYGSAL